MQDTLMQDLALLGQEMGLPSNDDGLLEVIARRTLEASEKRSTREQPALLVFDNVDSAP
jgi:hypothetical protein